ncbi:alanine racemase [Arsenicicoccus piscis]|uniref:D-serine dehydratase-like domain-containing protein n=1 Tax=Arsenicicoccus piscis TaxID=673954 RepID=A0ABQ6HQC6_9MICO|nr:alanine racemase [Arsenicicoccus piscis]MCH8629330.1 alanine racemase [Arsenicicoccus piscis]GMA20390.1 hypothetical protein GCM10025862_24110 [Arsenicicoccus piscis]
MSAEATRPTDLARPSDLAWPAELAGRTPLLVVDLDRLDRAISRMAAHVAGLGLAARPHAKTHKCVEIAQRQLAAGAVGLTVATVGEAEVFADGGCRDLFIAYPVWAAGERGERLAALADRVSLQVGVDSAEASELLAEALGGRDVGVLVEIDSGHHRSGVDPVQAPQVALAAAAAGLRVDGVFSFPGHGYGPGGGAQAAADEAAALGAAAEAMRAAGLEVRVVSGGSTPTADAADARVLTELRPGVYVFYDAQQAELGTCTLDDIALTAATTVVSRRRTPQGGQVVVDAGSKTLGADRPAWATGHGRVPAVPDARVVALSEHHATITWPDGWELPALGTVLQVAPNHACNAVGLADELVVVQGGAVVDTWQVAARGRNA